MYGRLCRWTSFVAAVVMLVVVVVKYLHTPTTTAGRTIT